MVLNKVTVFLMCLCVIQGVEEGEQCTKNGSPAVCINIRKCQSAIDEIRRRQTPQICGFSGADPIVCCLDSNPGPRPTTGRPPVASTSTRRPSQTTEYVPPVYDYKEEGGDGECSPIAANLTAARNGKKAWDKCLEYQEQLVYPCVKGVALAGEKSRADRCGHAADELIVGGVDAGRNEFPHMVRDGATQRGVLRNEFRGTTRDGATWYRVLGDDFPDVKRDDALKNNIRQNMKDGAISRKGFEEMKIGAKWHRVLRNVKPSFILGGFNAARIEFPHMALLGYGDNPQSLQFLCGGALISDRFILTAGHCTNSRDAGPVTYVSINKLRRSAPENSRLFRVENIVRHPQYKPPLKYNDIALLRTATVVTLDQFTVPACLHTGETVNDDRALATGWGAVEYRGEGADTLQKVTLTKFKQNECSAQFPVNRNMPRGVDHTTQICYGDYTRSKDTCQGDSGGPLQIKNKRIHCMYTLVGVTSFGKACGFAGEPGIYTRVAPYVEWIESVVWP